MTVLAGLTIVGNKNQILLLQQNLYIITHH